MKRRIRYLTTIGVMVVTVAVAASTIWLMKPSYGPADSRNAEQVALGHPVYADHCASCHGVNLEGQPNWRRRNADGKLPAPPHDDSGHTWEHRDEVLFNVTKYGVTQYAGATYQSDMPAFDGVLTDEQIWAVLAYIKSRWSPTFLERNRRANGDSEVPSGHRANH